MRDLRLGVRAHIWARSGRNITPADVCVADVWPQAIDMCPRERGEVGSPEWRSPIIWRRNICALMLCCKKNVPRQLDLKIGLT